MRTDFLCISVLKVASGPRVKLASCKSALNPTPSTPGGLLYRPRSKAVVQVLVLHSRHSLDFSLTFCTLCCFVVYSAGRFVVCLSVCHFVLVFFSPFSIAITSLGEDRAYLSFVCLCLFRFVGFLFLLRSGKGCGL